MNIKPLQFKPPPELRDRVHEALQKSCSRAGKIILKSFGENKKIKSKGDNNWVTETDLKAENSIIRCIKEYFPGSSFLAEESGRSTGPTDLLWIIDPIDGTRSYIAGHKDFGTLIALLHNQEPILGIVDCPAHKERWLGICNENTTLNGEKIKTSNKQNINESYAFTSGLYFEDMKFRDGFDKITKKTKYFRFGGDCYMYGMLASGFIDIVVAVSYTHLTLPTNRRCRSRWSPYH